MELAAACFPSALLGAASARAASASPTKHPQTKEHSTSLKYSERSGRKRENLTISDETRQALEAASIVPSRWYREGQGPDGFKGSGGDQKSVGCLIKG